MLTLVPGFLPINPVLLNKVQMFKATDRLQWERWQPEEKENQNHGQCLWGRKPGPGFT